MKKTLYSVHKWLALFFSIPFFVLALTGIVMTLEPKSNSKLGIKNPLPLHTVLQKYHQENPESHITRVNFNDETATLYVKAGDMKHVTIERGEGKIIKEENPLLNPFKFSKTMHESFFLKGPGKNLVAICGLGLLLVLLSGFFYWSKKNFLSQIINLLKRGKISKAKDLHVMAGLLLILPLLFSASTGFLIELNKLFWTDKKFDEHIRPSACTFSEQLEVIRSINPEAGRINFCRPDYPYMTLISKTESKEITPAGQVVQTVQKENWSENFFYRKHHFVHLHGGDEFGAVKTPYRLYNGLGFLLLNLTGILIWWKKRAKL